MNKRIIIFIVITYGFTWALWIPLLLNKQFNAGLQVIQGQFYLASFGPLVGAAITVLLVEKKYGFIKWVKRVYSIKFSYKCFLVSIGLPVAYGIISVLAHNLVTGTWPDWNNFGLTKKLPGLNILSTMLIWMLTFGVGEESGWRGFLLPEINKKYSIVKSSLIVSAIWMLWHLPAFWFNDNYMSMGFGIIGWIISLSYGSILLAWLCKSSNWSVIPVILWHGGFDLITASDEAAKVMAMVCSMIVITQGIFISRKLQKKI